VSSATLALTVALIVIMTEPPLAMLPSQVTLFPGTSATAGARGGARGDEGERRRECVRELGAGVVGLRGGPRVREGDRVGDVPPMLKPPRTVLVRVPRTTVAGENVALQDLAASTVMANGLVVPVQSPLQPVKTEPAAGVAVRLTTVPCA